MRIGVLSDTHVPSVYRTIPEGIWRALDGCDAIIHAGDFDGWETYEAFKSRFPTFAVVGNRDTFGRCEEVPMNRVEVLNGFSIGITHGTGPRFNLPQRIRTTWRGPHVDLLIFGHSHEAGICEIDGIRMLNPGSATDVLADRQTIAILDLKEKLEITIQDIQV